MQDSGTTFKCSAMRINETVQHHKTYNIMVEFKRTGKNTAVNINQQCNNTPSKLNINSTTKIPFNRLSCLQTNFVKLAVLNLPLKKYFFSLLLQFGVV